MEKTARPHRVLTETQVAALLGVTTRTLQRWHADRTSPIRRLPNKDGRAIRYAKADVQRYLRGGR